MDPADDNVITCLDIRVGKIVSCKNMEGSDKLYLEEIDVGDEKLRTVLSGLRGKVPLEDMTGLVAVVCNLKPRKMQGIKSEAMVLAAVGETATELLRPAAGSIVGSRINFDGIDMSAGGIASGNALNKGAGKKALEAILTDATFATTTQREAAFRGHIMSTENGEVTVKTVSNAKIK